MKRVQKWSLILFPVVVWVLVITYGNYQNSKVNRLVKDIDGLTYGSGNELLVVHKSRNVENEVTTDVITVTNSEGGTVLETIVSMDHDLYGKGFIKAVQVDGDSELEVVVWGNNILEGESFFLDFVNGNVQQIPFDEVSNDTKKFIKEYLHISSLLPLLLALLIITTPIYYIIYFIFASKRKASATTDSTK